MQVELRGLLCSAVFRDYRQQPYMIGASEDVDAVHWLKQSVMISTCLSEEQTLHIIHHGAHASLFCMLRHIMRIAQNRRFERADLPAR